jgi:hypothetical protein
MVVKEVSCGLVATSPSHDVSETRIRMGVRHRHRDWLR